MKRLLPLLFILNAQFPILNSAWAQSFTAENHDNEYVTLSWEGFSDEVSLGRRFSDEGDWREIARVREGPFRDTIRRILCQDTVSYRLVHEADTLFAQVPFTDDRPTGAPSWGLCTVDTATQRVTLRWDPSPDPDIWGHVVCRGDSPSGPWLAADTLWSADQTETSLDDDPLQPHYYRLYAFDSCLTASAMTDLRGNMALRFSRDLEARSLALTWSPCAGVGECSYRVVLVQSSEDQPLGTTNTDVTSCQATLSVLPSATRVQATVLCLQEGSPARPRSNRVECSFPPQDPPPPPQPPTPPPAEEDTVKGATAIWMPNAFSPSMSSNSQYCPRVINATDYHLWIFTRQGQLVMESGDPAGCWDGRLPSGADAPMGTYVYHLHCKNHHGDKLVKTGTILLVR